MKSTVRLLSIAALCTLPAVAPAASDNTDDATFATLHWNRTTREAIVRMQPSQHQAIRLLAYVSLAQYTALADAQGENGAADTVATVSARVIADLAPSQAGFAQTRLRASGSRENGRGRHVAGNVLAQAHSDNFAHAPAVPAAQGAYTWKSLANPPAPPAYPALGAMRTFFIDSGNAFRAPPPPVMGSLKFQGDLAEVQHYTMAPTQATVRIAKFYDMTTGTLAAGYWNEQAEELIRRNRPGELRAARILAAMNLAMMDAVIACHDTKYAYWVPRPSQADPDLVKPVIGVPNHPSYPSNHSCISTAAALVLAHFFPQERGHLENIAMEAGVSRIYAGLHYRFDVVAGEDIGRKVAAAAVSRHEDLLARWTRTLLAQHTRP